MQIAALVDEALNCAGLMIRPDTDECVQITLSWERVLLPIPDEWLAEALILALRGHDREGLISPGRVVAAWDEIRAQNARKRTEAEGQKYLVDRSPTTNNARYFAAGLEAARRMRGISTPAGELFDEADVQAALRAIAPMQDHGERQRLEEMRRQPADVRAEYKRPGRDTLEKLTGVKAR